MSIHDYESDYELTEALGKLIGLKRLEDVIPGEDYVLHASYWWKVTGEVGETGALGLEIANPTGPGKVETAVLAGDGGDLVVTTYVSSGLQFQDGALLGVPWPSCPLVYVKDARRRGAWDDPNERVFGIFILRHGPDWDPYYVPVNPEMQPGVESNWALFPGTDLILAWEPVDVADLLREYSGESRD